MNRHADACTTGVGCTDDVKAVGESILSACREMYDAGQNEEGIRADPAVRLLAYQMTIILNVYFLRKEPSKCNGFDDKLKLTRAYAEQQSASEAGRHKAAIAIMEDDGTVASIAESILAGYQEILEERFSNRLNLWWVKMDAALHLMAYKLADLVNTDELNLDIKAFNANLAICADAWQEDLNMTKGPRP